MKTFPRSRHPELTTLWACAIGAIVLGSCATIAGMIALGLAASKRQKPQMSSPASPLLQVRQLQVVDGTGRMRASIIAEDAGVGLSLYDQGGGVRAQMLYRENFGAGIEIRDGKGQDRFVLMLTNPAGLDPGQVALMLFDPAGKLVWSSQSIAGKGR